jgi:regulator of ribosome biosynthesis
MTRWEKFRLEKGMPARKKRSRMVYDPITQDWVPRHGFGSAKKIADKHQWVMEDKPKHLTSKTDPYTYAK